MHTNGKYNFGYLVLFLVGIFASCSLTSNYIVDVQSTLDPGHVSNNETMDVPLVVSSYYDDTGTEECGNIASTSFTKSSAYFNPGFYKGTLWLDIFFPDTTEKLGDEYMIDFGSEPIDYAEVFAPVKDSWKLYGRTGRMLNRKQMSSPSWRLFIPLNEISLEKNVVHHIRVKMMAHIGSPVKIKIIPRRFYDFQTEWFSMVCYICGGLFLIAIIFILLYGIIFKDPIYRLLSGTAFFLFLTEMEIKGTGPVFFWNFLVTIPHSPRLMYVFSDITILFLVSTVMFIALENNRKIAGQEIAALIIGVTASGIIASFSIRSPVIVYFVFVIGLLISCVLFILLFHKNRIERRKDIYLLFAYWEAMVVIVFIRQLFHLLRIYFSLKLFKLFDNDFYITIYVVFLLIITPALYLTGRRLQRRFSLMTARLMVATRRLSEMHEAENLYALATKELLAEQNVLLNTISMPQHIDNNEDRETYLLMKKTSARSVDLLNAICIFENDIIPEEKAILLFDFFNSCIRVIEPYAKLRGNTLAVTSAFPTDCVISVNPKIMELIISDSLIAVLAVSPRDTRIAVTITVDGNKLTYTIQNDIKLYRDTDKAEYNPDDVVSLANKGFNLLFIKKAAELYHGTVTVDATGNVNTYTTTLFVNHIAEKGQDTQVIISSSRELFIQDDMPVPKEQLTIPDTLLSQNGKTPLILLVESSKSNVNMISLILEKHSILLKATNGLDAWNLLNSYDKKSALPDLIISEYELPLLNGSELFRKCRQEQLLQDIPFIFLASITNYSKKNEIINKGAADCLIKPFSVTDFFNRISSVLTVQSMAHHAVLSKISTLVQVKPAEPQETSIPSLGKTSALQTTVSLTSTQQALFNASALSSREQQIALLISEGKSDKQIADELFISAATVATHNKKLFKKLGVHSRVELMNKVR